MIVYTINLRADPQMIEEYKKYHRNVWDDVIEGMKDIGIKSCRIFLLGNRLVNIMEVDDEFDPDNDLKNYYKVRPKAEEWDKLMATYQIPVPEARKYEWWALMEQVFEFKSES
jgi:L-rhamnose mutarotase